MQEGGSRSGRSRCKCRRAEEEETAQNPRADEQEIDQAAGERSEKEFAIGDVENKVCV